jgi:hypothetical protein
MDLSQSIACPGAVGLLHETKQSMTFAHVRPFIWSILLFEGRIDIPTAVGVITPVCSNGDLRSDWNDCPDDYCDIPRVQWLVEQVIGEMTAAGLLVYDIEQDNWELTAGENLKHLHIIIKAVSGVDAALPSNIKMEVQ